MYPDALIMLVLVLMLVMAGVVYCNRVHITIWDPDGPTSLFEQVRDTEMRRAYKGNTEAQFNIGMYYAFPSEQDLEEAQKYLKMAADKGHLWAAFELAKLYEETNSDLAAKYYKQAAEAGQREARSKPANIKKEQKLETFSPGKDEEATKKGYKPVQCNWCDELARHWEEFQKSFTKKKVEMTKSRG
jgi:TPR repeat protein